MTQMLAQREHDYFAETVICANCYIVAKIVLYFLLFFGILHLYYLCWHTTCNSIVGDVFRNYGTGSYNSIFADENIIYDITTTEASARKRQICSMIVVNCTFCVTQFV